MANTSYLPPSSARPRHLNPDASHFQPGDGFEGSRDFLLSDMLDRLNKVEHSHEILSGHVGHLDTEHAALSRAVADLRNGFQSANNTHLASYPQGLDGPADTDDSEHRGKPANGTAYVPPHLRPTAASLNGTASVPPHLPNKAANLSLAADAKAQYAALFDAEPTQLGPTDPPTPPLDPNTPLPSIEKPQSTPCQEWTPIALTHFPKVDPDQLASVPSPTEIVTFSYDFLTNTFGGSFWTPGLKYIPPPAVCMLPTRSYWLMDGAVEPYLPKAPGQHGAKLTAFFNPEDPAEDWDGGENVPMFVCNTPWAVGNARRYVYMGNYSQGRWSDKLDYDRMMKHVPEKVKNYWAEDLSATGRAEWVTEALKKHFFPMPEYDGRLPRGDVNGSVAPDEDAKEEEKVMNDLKEYLAELREWKHEAELKTKLIKKDFILQAFERPDVDLPPGLRLQLEYLQCTQYDRSFYDMLVQLQSRNESYLK